MLGIFTLITKSLVNKIYEGILTNLKLYTITLLKHQNSIL